jgi:hypothetical protein
MTRSDQQLLQKLLDSSNSYQEYLQSVHDNGLVLLQYLNATEYLAYKQGIQREGVPVLTTVVTDNEWQALPIDVRMPVYEEQPLPSNMFAQHALFAVAAFYCFTGFFAFGIAILLAATLFSLSLAARRFAQFALKQPRIHSVNEYHRALSARKHAKHLPHAGHNQFAVKADEQYLELFEYQPKGRRYRIVLHEALQDNLVDLAQQAERFSHKAEELETQSWRQYIEEQAHQQITKEIEQEQALFLQAAKETCTRRQLLEEMLGRHAVS